MRKFALVLCTMLVALMGVGAAFAISKHTGTPNLDCSGAHVDYNSFASGVTNNVTEQLLVDGSVVVTKPFSFSGSTGHDDIPFPTPLNGNYIVQVKASWNTNGHSGSFDSGPQKLGCFTKTVTTTTTATVTTPTQTVTGPTTTVQLPAPPPVPAVTTTVSTSSIRLVTKTVTVKSPPRIVKVRVPAKPKKAPICKPKKSKTLPPTK